MAGIFAVSLRGDPAGHPCDRNRAPASYLPAAADGGYFLRLDRWLLSSAVQHDVGPQFGRSQSRRAVSALWRFALADAAFPQASLRAALYSRRLAHRGRAVADRRGGRGD